MARRNDLLERIEKLEARNKRVEGDKAWEISWTRRLAIMLLTYLTVAFYLHFVVHIKPWINALVPVIGYTLSTLTIQQLKQRWLAQRKSKRPGKQR
jgi:hypothetical protein